MNTHLSAYKSKLRCGIHPFFAEMSVHRSKKRRNIDKANTEVDANGNFFCIQLRNNLPIT